MANISHSQGSTFAEFRIFGLLFVEVILDQKMNATCGTTLVSSQD
jgi:hypothetical protein